MVPLALTVLGLLTKKTDRWAGLAGALGFSLEGPPPKGFFAGDLRLMQGRHAGRTAEVRPFLVEHGSGDDAGQSVFTAVQLHAPDTDTAFHLRVTREGLGAKLAKAAGGQDLAVGDEAFDKAFRVQSNREHAVPQVLHLGVRQALLGLPKFHALVVEGGILRVEHSTQVFDADIVRGDLEALARLADALPPPPSP